MKYLIGTMGISVALSGLILLTFGLWDLFNGRPVLYAEVFVPAVMVILGGVQWKIYLEQSGYTTRIDRQ